MDPKVEVNLPLKHRKRIAWGGGKKGEIAGGIVLLSPAIIILFITSLLPLFYAIGVSFTHWNLASAPIPKFTGLKNYIDAFKDRSFGQSLFITVEFVIITVVLETILGMILALLFSREGKRHNLARTLLITPMVATPVAIGILWRIMLDTNYGVINYFLSFFGIPKLDWLGTPSLAYVSILLVDIWMWTPFMVVAFVAALVSLPGDVIKAAKMDGASNWQIFWKLKLPMMKPVVIVTILLRFIDAFKVIDTVYVMTYGGPGNATRVLSMFIYQESLKYFDLGYGSAISMLFIILMLILGWYFVRQRLRA